MELNWLWLEILSYQASFLFLFSFQLTFFFLNPYPREDMLFDFRERVREVESRGKTSM